MILFKDYFLRYSMCENKELLTWPDLYRKITILTSTLVDKGCERDGYYVNHEIKEIIKQNNLCHIRTKYEQVDISKDLEQTESKIYYDCDRSSHEFQFEKPIDPKLYEILENCRSKTAKRVFKS